jgi:hypothetical protein
MNWETIWEKQMCHVLNTDELTTIWVDWEKAVEILTPGMSAVLLAFINHLLILMT